jgi:hypothetical protein
LIDKFRFVGRYVPAYAHINSNRNQIESCRQDPTRLNQHLFKHKDKSRDEVFDIIGEYVRLESIDHMRSFVLSGLIRLIDFDTQGFMLSVRMLLTVSIC